MIHDDVDDSPWSHAICDGCWWRRHELRTPVRVADVCLEACCFCGGPATGGVYVRANPGGGDLACAASRDDDPPALRLARLRREYVRKLRDPVILDNDHAGIWDGDDYLFSMHPEDMLRAALTLLGIPHASA